MDEPAEEVVACQRRLRTVSKKLRQIAELQAAVDAHATEPQPAQRAKLAARPELEAELERLTEELRGLELRQAHAREEAAEREERKRQADDAHAAQAVATHAVMSNVAPAAQPGAARAAPAEPARAPHRRPPPLEVCAAPPGAPAGPVGAPSRPVPPPIHSSVSNDSFSSMESGSTPTEMQRRVRNAQKRVRQAKTLQEASWNGKPLNAEQKAKVLSLPTLQEELRGLLEQLEEEEPDVVADAPRTPDVPLPVPREATLGSTPRPRLSAGSGRTPGSFVLPPSVKSFHEKTSGGGMVSRGASVRAPGVPDSVGASTSRSSRRSAERLSSAFVSLGGEAPDPASKQSVAHRLAELRSAAVAGAAGMGPASARCSSERSLLRGSGASAASWEEMADSGKLVLPADASQRSSDVPTSVRPSGKSAEEEEADSVERRVLACEARATEEARRREEAKQAMLDKLYNFKSPARPQVSPAPHLFPAGAAVGSMPPGALGLPPPSPGDSTELKGPDVLAVAPAEAPAEPHVAVAPLSAVSAATVAAAAESMGADGPADSTTAEAVAEALPGADGGADEPLALGMDDFELLRLIGKGGYGKVFQVRCTLNSEVYAMKVVDKASIERFRSMDNIATELAVLRRYAEHRHPFILGLECAFQSPLKLHFVMEFVPGGMLFNHLRQQEMFSEKMARFYTAEVLLGLEHLHGMCIIYRDLKPENVLVCADGNIKLCDFGLAAIGLTAPATQPSASGRPVLIGTTEYMAPEIIRMLECGQAVDIWALGVLLYEMVTGEAPWYHKEAKELQRKIVHTKPKLPTWLANEARNLLRGLLTKEARQRLGVKPDSESFESDAEAIKAHPFFRGLNWKMLEMRKLEPPLLPSLSQGALDVSNFDSKYTLERPEMSPPRRPLSSEMEARFSNLDLEYMSPETRNSVRASVRSSNASSIGSARSSRRSPVSSASEALLRFPKHR